MFSREKDPGLGRSGSVRPRLEALEDRCCPSSVTFSNHLLTITGDSSNSTVVMSDDGRGDVKVTLNGHTYSETGVQQILINSKTGSDTIKYSLTNTLTSSEKLTVNLGSGEDLVNLNYSKGVSAPNLNISLNGGGGDASVTTDFGAITNTDLQLAAQLGNGWEQFTAAFNGNLAGKANVNVNVKGGQGLGGTNVTVNGNIASTAQMNVTEHLGTLNNTSHFSYTGLLDGKLSVLLYGGTSWNWLESHFNLTAGSDGTLIAEEFGGPSSDMLILTVKDAGSHLKTLEALINGEGGRNSAVSTPNVTVLNAHH